MPTLRTDIPEESNTESVMKDLDMADELGEVVAIRIAQASKPIQQTCETPNVLARGPGPEKSF